MIITAILLFIISIIYGLMYLLVKGGFIVWDRYLSHTIKGFLLGAFAISLFGFIGFCIYKSVVLFIKDDNHLALFAGSMLFTIFYLPLITMLLAEFLNNKFKCDFDSIGACKYTIPLFWVYYIVFYAIIFLYGCIYYSFSIDNLITLTILILLVGIFFIFPVFFTFNRFFLHYRKSFKWRIYKKGMSDIEASYLHSAKFADNKSYIQLLSDKYKLSFLKNIWFYDNDWWVDRICWESVEINDENEAKMEIQNIIKMFTSLYGRPFDIVDCLNDSNQVTLSSTRGHDCCAEYNWDKYTYPFILMKTKLKVETMTKEITTIEGRYGTKKKINILIYRYSIIQE